MFKRSILLILFVFFLPITLFAGNPLVTNIFTADPAAMVHNGKFYIYCGHDEQVAGASDFVMWNWHILSSSDMVNWTDHGAKLSVGDFNWANANAWAGHAIERNGKFYWYVPLQNKNGSHGWMGIGVAVADSPTGPFRDARGSALITSQTKTAEDMLNIDPAVFIDDDGAAYIYWGSWGQIRMARLQDNMIELAETPKVVNAPRFFEAAWVHKRNGIYYLSYSAGSNPATIEYCTSNSPYGPWTHRGVVNDRVYNSPTNHHAIVEFQNQWYFVYHNGLAPGGGEFRRSVCVDYLYYNEDGTMKKVVQTTKGVDPVGTAPPPSPPANADNLALSATRSTSYVSEWENLAAINDGYTPSGSADHTNGAYGNWPETGTQWIQYNWSSPVTADQMSVYWFDDDMGIDLPSSSRLLYWNGSAWVKVENPNGYGVNGNQYNITTFDSVSTTGLRLEMVSNGSYSTGVLEWEVSGEDDSSSSDSDSDSGPSGGCGW